MLRLARESQEPVIIYAPDGWKGLTNRFVSLLAQLQPDIGMILIVVTDEEKRFRYPSLLPGAAARGRL